jgi:Peptidase A4 family
MHKMHFAISMIAAAGAIAVGPAPAAADASTDVAQSASANWSGYVAKDSSGGSRPFSSVQGSWVEPSADCSSGDGDAAFWVGLGGGSSEANALEQVGTQVDCRDGEHFAWYELVPAAPVRLDVAINPGDHVSAHVSVSGTAVTVSLLDQSTGASATKTLQMDNPDVSSAEWIAEAPSLCQGGDASNTENCTPVSLADFGTVTFTGASATANGRTGSISSPNWSAQAVQLSGASQGATSYPGVLDLSATDTTSRSATPSTLSADGSSFSVAWQSDASQPAASSSYPGDPGSGYGPTDNYGYGNGGYSGGDPGDSYGFPRDAYGHGAVGY